MSFPALAAIKAVYTFIAKGRTRELTDNLSALVALVYSRLQLLRDQYSSSNNIEGLIEIPSGCPKSPIISLLTPDPRSLAQYCQVAGYVVRAIVAPTVPAGFERVRVCLHSGNTLGQIEGFIRTLEKWIEQERQKKNRNSELPRARI